MTVVESKPVAGIEALTALLDASTATVKFTDAAIRKFVVGTPLAWIGTTSARLLAIVSHNEGITPSAIALVLLQETHSVSGLLNRLEDAPPLLTRTRDKADRRVVHVHLTADGKRFVGMATPALIAAGAIVKAAAENSRDPFEAFANIRDRMKLATK
jgi:DNA-binding MarR family transcriptional regulator